AERLQTMGHRQVYVIQWKEAPATGDAADFAGTDEELLALIDAAEPIQEPDPYPNRHAVDAAEAYERYRQEERRYSVAGLVTLGQSAVITALIEGGKSTLLRTLARCWATGEPFLEREVIPGRVLVVVSSKEYDCLG